MKIDHIHFKTSDPDGVIKLFEKHFGAKVVAKRSGGAFIMIDGLKIAVSKILPEQKRNQKLGFEHVAFVTENFDKAVKNAATDGFKILEESKSKDSGRRMCFLEGPEGVQFELIEKAK
jgi:lactoylglutathione lyase